MFVKQLTETELNEYERQLQGVRDAVGQLAANDEVTREAVRSFLDGAEGLQMLVREQIVALHRDDPPPTRPDPD